MKQLTSCLLPRLLTWLLLGTACRDSAAESVLSADAIINRPSADAWALFATEAGLKSLGYAQASVELRLGGPLRADGGKTVLGDLNSVIISLDPEHMLSFKPGDQPANNQWTVLYFTAMGRDMTQVRWLEFFPDAQRAIASDRQQQVQQLFQQLIRRYAPECEVCKLEKARAAPGK